MKSDISDVDDVFGTYLKRQERIDLELSTNKIDVDQHKTMTDNNLKLLKSEVDAVWGSSAGKGVNKSNIQKQLMAAGVSRKWQKGLLIILVL